MAPEGIDWRVLSIAPDGSDAAYRENRNGKTSIVWKLGRLDDLDTVFILTPAVNVFRLGTTFSINVARTFILDQGDALELQNSGLFDQDPGIQEDDPFQDASKVFNFPLEDETGSISSPGNGSNLVTSYKVEVNF